MKIIIADYVPIFPLLFRLLQTRQVSFSHVAHFVCCTRRSKLFRGVLQPQRHTSLMSSLRITVVCYLSFLFLYQLFYSKVTLRRLSLLTHYPCFTFNFSHQENLSSFFFTFQSRSILISFIVLLYDVLQSVTITSLLPLLRSFSNQLYNYPFFFYVLFYVGFVVNKL